MLSVRRTNGVFRCYVVVKLWYKKENLLLFFSHCFPIFTLLDMPRPPRAAQRNRPDQSAAQGSDWTYDFRSSHPSLDSASGSGSDSDSDPVSSLSLATEDLTDDAKLLQELDLTSRQDTAQYKPNPWSIAKVNAASRPSMAMLNTTGRKDEKVDLGTGSGQNRKESKGSIVDFFRKQASDKQQVKKTKPPSLIPPSQHQPSPHQAPSAIAALEGPFSKAHRHAQHSSRNHLPLPHTVNPTPRDVHFADTAPSFDHNALNRGDAKLSLQLFKPSSSTDIPHDSILGENAHISSDTITSWSPHSPHSTPALETATMLTADKHTNISNLPAQYNSPRDSSHVPLLELAYAHLDTDGTHAHPCNSPPLDPDTDCIPPFGLQNTHISTDDPLDPDRSSHPFTDLAEHGASLDPLLNETHIPTPLSSGSHHNSHPHADGVFYSSPPRPTSSRTPFYAHGQPPPPRLGLEVAYSPGPLPRNHVRPSMIHSFSSPRPPRTGTSSIFTARSPQNPFPMCSPNMTNASRPAHVHGKNMISRSGPGFTSGDLAGIRGSIRSQTPYPSMGRMNNLKVEGLSHTLGFGHTDVTVMNVRLTEHCYPLVSSEDATSQPEFHETVPDFTSSGSSVQTHGNEWSAVKAGRSAISLVSIYAF